MGLAQGRQTHFCWSILRFCGESPPWGPRRPKPGLYDLKLNGPPAGERHAKPPPYPAPLAAQKGGRNSSITLNQTSYGAILRVHWGPLNRTFPAQYSPTSALSVENPCFGPQTRVPRSASKKGQNGAKPEPAMGMAGGDARGALGTAAPMGRAQLMTGFIAPHSTCALGHSSSCVRATSADSDTQ